MIHVVDAPRSNYVPRALLLDVKVGRKWEIQPVKYLRVGYKPDQRSSTSQSHIDRVTKLSKFRAGRGRVP
jgi:hypothetical protein